MPWLDEYVVWKEDLLDLCFLVVYRKVKVSLLGCLLASASTFNIVFRSGPLKVVQGTPNQDGTITDGIMHILGLFTLDYITKCMEDPNLLISETSLL